MPDGARPPGDTSRRQPARAPARRRQRRRGSRGNLARAGPQPAVRLRGPRSAGHRAQLLLHRLGGTRVERGRRARPAAHRPGAPPLPLRRVLSRAGGAGGPGRSAGHPPGRDGRQGGADRRRAPQGVRQPRARSHPADVDDRVPRAACSRGRVCDRAGAEARRRVGLAAGRGRRVHLRRRLRQPRGRAGRAEQRCAPRAPGAAPAASLRLRGQPARDQRPLARGLGGIGAPRPSGAQLRGRVRRRPRSRPRDGRGPRRPHPRGAPARRPPPAHGPLPQPRRRRRRDGVQDAAGDPRRLGRRPAARDRALAGGRRHEDGGGAGGGLPGRARARARGRPRRRRVCPSSSRPRTSCGPSRRGRRSRPARLQAARRR